MPATEDLSFVEIACSSYFVRWNWTVSINAKRNFFNYIQIKTRNPFKWNASNEFGWPHRDPITNLKMNNSMILFLAIRKHTIVDFYPSSSRCRLTKNTAKTKIKIPSRIHNVDEHTLERCAVWTHTHTHTYSGQQTLVLVGDVCVRTILFFHLRQNMAKAEHNSEGWLQNGITHQIRDWCECVKRGRKTDESVRANERNRKKKKTSPLRTQTHIECVAKRGNAINDNERNYYRNEAAIIHFNMVYWISSRCASGKIESKIWIHYYSPRDESICSAAKLDCCLRIFIGIYYGKMCRSNGLRLFLARLNWFSFISCKPKECIRCSTGAYSARVFVCVNENSWHPNSDRRMNVWWRYEW